MRRPQSSSPLVLSVCTPFRPFVASAASRRVLKALRPPLLWPLVYWDNFCGDCSAANSAVCWEVGCWDHFLFNWFTGDSSWCTDGAEDRLDLLGFKSIVWGRLSLFCWGGLCWRPLVDLIASKVVFGCCTSWGCTMVQIDSNRSVLIFKWFFFKIF